jgi:hypothetical protein
VADGNAAASIDFGDSAAALGSIITSCLAPTAVERPPSAAAMADQLRALTPVGDWDDTRARTWWAAFRADDDAASAASSLPTLTVDLDDRGDAPG